MGGNKTVPWTDGKPHVVESQCGGKSVAENLECGGKWNATPLCSRMGGRELVKQGRV